MIKNQIQEAQAFNNFNLYDYVLYKIESENLKKYLELESEAQDNAKNDILYMYDQQTFLERFMDSHINEIDWYVSEFVNFENQDQDLREMIGSILQDNMEADTPIIIDYNRHWNITIPNAEYGFITFELWKTLLSDFIELLENDQEIIILQDGTKIGRTKELSLKDIGYYASFSKVNISEAIKEYKETSEHDLKIFFDVSEFVSYIDSDHDHRLEGLENKETNNLLSLCQYVNRQITETIKELDWFIEQLLEGDLDNLEYCFNEDESEYINDDYLFTPKGDLRLKPVELYYDYDITEAVSDL